MRNWKTSLAGILTAGFGFVLFSPDLFAHWPWLVAVAKYAMVGGLASMGFAAKDSTTHSTVAQVEDASAKT
jgi:hypothetical protein